MITDYTARRAENINDKTDSEMNSKTNSGAGSKKSCETNSKTNSKTNSGHANTGEIILYQTSDGQSKIEVTLSDETVWLTADQMAELFQRDKSTISRHIRNVFEEGELPADSTVAFFATVQKEGAREVERNIAYYNLDMIISIGYRVKSHRGV